MKKEDAGAGSAQYHMQRDRALLEGLGDAALDARLIWYEWLRPSITYGHFIHPERLLYLEKTAAHGIDIARRPTGGGLLFHMDDCVFTLVIPKNHPRYTDNVRENYRWINEAVARACGTSEELLLERAIETSKVYDSYCMATPTIYDIMLDGKKVGGSAQRKTKNGYIHQASLFIGEPNWDIIDEVMIDKEAVQMMRKKSGWIEHLSKAELRRAIARELENRARK